MDNNILKPDLDILTKEIEDELSKKHITRVRDYENKGRDEGQLNLPSENDEDFSDIEYAIRNDYKGDINLLAKKGLPLLDEPHFRYNKLTKDLENIRKNLKAVQKERLSEETKIKDRKLNEAKSNHSNKLEIIDNKKKGIVREKQDATNAYQDIANNLGRKYPILHIKSSFVEWLILIFLGLCEIPLNYTVFANFLLPKIETYILSLLLVIAVPIVSHYLGICFKQYEETRKYIYHIFFLIPFMTGLNITVSILRAKYIHEVTKISPETIDSVTFVLLSTLLLIVGIIISFLHHDKNQELAEAFNRYERAKAEYDKKILPIIDEENKENEIFSKIVQEIENDFNNQQIRIQNLVPSIKDEIVEIVKIHDSILNAFKALEQFIDTNYKSCIAKYRHKNLRARTNHKKPISWKKIKPIDFKFLQKMELDVNKEINT